MNKEAEKSGDKNSVQQVKGEKHHGWTPFYHASDGSWKMLDIESYVLKEKKFVSSDKERDEYLIRKVKAGGILKIIESQGRWKQVEVIEHGSVIASGWIDAHFIENVEKVEGLSEQKEKNPDEQLLFL